MNIVVFRHKVVHVSFFSFDMVRLLIHHKAEATAVNSDGDSAMTIAASCSASKMVKYLLKKNDRLLELRNFQGASPLMMAVKGGRVKIAKYLLQKGANPNSTHFDSSLTCLDMALLSRDDEMINLIQAFGGVSGRGKGKDKCVTM